MIICGQSNSGKSVILNNMFKRKLVHEYNPEDIYFFSKTARGDLKYKPLFKYLATKKKKIQVFDKVDFNKINEIVKSQESVGQNQMFALKKEDEPKLKSIVFVFDDMLSDKAFKHHTSDLSTFSCLCRHYGISMIILTQKWTSVPDTIRIQSNISILCATDNYKKSMIDENAKKGQEKWLEQVYQDTNDRKDYSFLIINKSNTPGTRNCIVYPGGSFEYVLP